MFVVSCPIRGKMFICLTQISKFALVTSQLFCWSTSILFVIRHTVVGSPCLLITSLHLFVGWDSFMCWMRFPYFGQNFTLFHWFKTYKSHLKALKSQHFFMRFPPFLKFPFVSHHWCFRGSGASSKASFPFDARWRVHPQDLERAVQRAEQVWKVKSTIQEGGFAGGPWCWQWGFFGGRFLLGDHWMISEIGWYGETACFRMVRQWKWWIWSCHPTKSLEITPEL